MINWCKQLHIYQAGAPQAQIFLEQKLHWFTVNARYIPLIEKDFKRFSGLKKNWILWILDTLTVELGHLSARPSLHLGHFELLDPPIWPLFLSNSGCPYGSLARSVPKPLKVPSLARSMPKPFKWSMWSRGSSRGTSLCHETLLLFAADLLLPWSSVANAVRLPQVNRR